VGREITAVRDPEHRHVLVGSRRPPTRPDPLPIRNGDRDIGRGRENPVADHVAPVGHLHHLVDQALWDAHGREHELDLLIEGWQRHVVALRDDGGMAEPDHGRSNAGPGDLRVRVELA
jgi:hypothetical protein